ncbi:hypothetical protein Bpfe_024784 [Biomphalaria pfeifferi]|uniref:Uncharacterized protein n=1 Tax=Biomphalaria pfeifferi TaxID=112525 RepID=A0AAD8EZJ4_BIOPF|nr:hypothetical protein Bpfe_024784 [Biomphalaria pfeifferi]
MASSQHSLPEIELVLMMLFLTLQLSSNKTWPHKVLDPTSADCEQELRSVEEIKNDLQSAQIFMQLATLVILCDS